MAFKTKFFTRSKKKEDIPILIRITNGRQFDYVAKSGLQISNVSSWNNKTGQPVKSKYFQESDKLSKKLADIEIFVKEEYWKQPTEIDKNWLPLIIDKYYYPEKYRQSDSLFRFIQNFTGNSEKRINEKTGKPISYKVRREYEVTFNYLKAYCEEENNGKELDFVDMDKEFKENFSSFLRAKELHENTIVRKITTLKLFLNEAKHAGKNPYDKYLGWKTKKTESDSVYLEEGELSKLYKHNFSGNKRIERVRDMFMIGAYTGLRYGELTRVTPENIVDEFIHVRQPKTYNRIVIPLHPVVKKIIEKYNGKLPAPISNQKYNAYLKEACKIAGIDSFAPFKSRIKDEKTGKIIFKHLPKYQLVGSHTARRSFATNAYLAGMDSMHIRAITGHKTESAYLKYIKASPEQHAKKIREFWREQGQYIKAQ